MKLTKIHKQAFVAAVMNDVPVSRDLNEEFRKIATEDMERQAPKALKEALKNKELRPYLFSGSHYWGPESLKVNNTYHSPRSFGISSIVTYKDYVPSPDAKAAAEALMASGLAANQTRIALEAKVTHAISGFSTLKSAHEGLPEFSKYLPEVPTKGSFLSAIANLAAELAIAGFPKGAAT